MDRRRLSNSGWEAKVRHPAAGSVLYYPGLNSDQATIKDFSGKNNHGAITGATWARLPSGLPYPSFDGLTHKITIANSTSFHPLTGSFTFRFWFRSDKDGMPIIHFGNDSIGTADQMYVYIGIVAANKLSFSLKNNGLGDIIGGGTAVIDNVWRHTVVVRNETDGKLYLLVNGASDAVAVAATNTTTTSIDFSAGGWIGTNYQLANFFRGGVALPEMMLNTAWSAADADRDYKSTKSLFGV